MSDDPKLRAIHEALDAGRPIELEGLDASARASAEGLARVDAWLRERPEPRLADPEALAARIEARLHEALDGAVDGVVEGDFDPLAVPDFSDFGDDARSYDEQGHDPHRHELESMPSSVRQVRAGASAPAAATGAAPHAAASAPAPATGGVSRTGASGASRSSGPARGWWIASAAVVMLAATGTFVAFQRASSPEAASSSARYERGSDAVATPAEAAPVAEESIAEASGSTGSNLVAPAAAPTDQPPEPAATAGWDREVGAQRRGAERAEGRALGGASASGVTEEPAEETAALAVTAEAYREQRARATTMSAPAQDDRWAYAEASPTAPPAGAAPTTTASTMRSARPAAASTGAREGEAAEDETLVGLERWRSRVLSCVPERVRTLTTIVEGRGGRIVALVDTTPALDAATRGCVQTALRGAPLDRPRATLRWKREP